MGNGDLKCWISVGKNSSQNDDFPSPWKQLSAMADVIRNTAVVIPTVSERKLVQMCFSDQLS
jgi:hypothetical protein